MGEPVPSADAPSRSPQRRHLVAGCLTAVVVVVIVATGLVVWGFASVDWGPPARGLARPEDVRPLPDGAEVVGEYAGCGGNGDGWHTCERRIRVRMSGVSRAELAAKLADLYRGRGYRMDDLRSTARGDTDSPLYGWTGCMSSVSKADGLCLSVNTPEDGSQFSRIPGQVGSGDVDVSAESFTYFI